MAVTSEAILVEKAVDDITEAAVDATHNNHLESSTSSHADRSGSNAGSFAKSSSKRYSSGDSSNLPITPGPLSFFAPSTATNAPGTFQSSMYEPGQSLLPVQAPQWAETDLHAIQCDAQMPRQMSPCAPMVYRNDDSSAIVTSDRRQSVAVPVVQPAGRLDLDLASETEFPALGTASPMRNRGKISMPEPPGLGAQRSDTQAAFDALLPIVEPPTERTSNLGKFITRATASPASLNGSFEEAMSEDMSTAKSIAQEELRATTKSPHTQYNDAFPELPRVNIPGRGFGGKTGMETQAPQDEHTPSIALAGHPLATTELSPRVEYEHTFPSQASDEVVAKAVKREQKKVARDELKDAWFEREESRKKLLGAFSVEGANDLKQRTIDYLDKQSVLQFLMKSGELNEQDAAMFPEFGLMDLAVPKVKAVGLDEWRHRKRESKTAITEFAEAAPVAPAERSDETDPVIKDMLTAQRHRNQAKDQLRQRPGTNMTYPTWVTTCRQKIARADKNYNRKRKTLAAAYPAGLPRELELRFPKI